MHWAHHGSFWDEPMSVNMKTLMNNSAKRMLDKAADCAEIAEIEHHVAEAQHQMASRQHCSADELEISSKKLKRLADLLEADAAEIMENTELVAPGILIPTSSTAAPHASLATKAAAKLGDLPFKP
jgi:hypothetical protein